MDRTDKYVVIDNNKTLIYFRQFEVSVRKSVKITYIWNVNESPDSMIYSWSPSDFHSFPSIKKNIFMGKINIFGEVETVWHDVW